MKRNLDYEHDFGNSEERYIGMDPKPLAPMPNEVKIALICDVAHGRRTDSALPFTDQCYLGAHWKDDIKQTFSDGYLKISNPFEKLQFCKNSDLKNLCKAHKLKMGGNKQDLIDRIVSNINENSISATIPFDFWVRTEKGDEALEMYSPHVRNYKNGNYYSHTMVTLYTDKVKQQYGKVDTNRVFYELNKHDLKKIMMELDLSYPKGSWSSLMLKYNSLNYWADFFGDYNHAIYYKIIELTVHLSGLTNGGIIKGFQYINPPSYQNDFSKTLIKYGKPIEDIMPEVFSAIEQIFKQLPFHYFSLTALQDIFYQTLQGRTVDLKLYNPLLQFSSENYGIWFNVDKDKNGKIVIIKND